MIDRWHNHPLYINAVVQRVQEGIAKLLRSPPPALGADGTTSSHPAPLALSDIVIVFSAHSVPMKVVYKGDQYVSEIYATVENVMSALYSQLRTAPPTAAAATDPVLPPYLVSWQSKVGYLPWMGPSTASTITQFAQNALLHSRHKLGKPHHYPSATPTPSEAPTSATAVPPRARAMLLVPIAFTSDHIETLFECDIEYKHLFEQTKAKAKHAQSPVLLLDRAPSLNDSALLTDAQAQIVYEHLQHTRSLPSFGAAAAAPAPAASSSAAAHRHSHAHSHATAAGHVCHHYSTQYTWRCIGCVNPRCRSIVNPVEL